jgi:4-diphosphocytidyl-2-C-methyl-D-erythritol kinase
MIQFPNCKINIGLNIVDRRPDGFHNIETVFYPVLLNDVLEIIPAQDGIFHFQSTGLSIPGQPEDNLCVKAYQLLQDEFGLPAVKIHLHKVIPMGSGLGGGSSDGAFTLKLLNELFTLGLDQVKLMSYASLLGSDCAFFIANQPKFAFEKGDHFEPVSIDFSGFYLVLVVPDVRVATAGAYRMVVPCIPEQSLKDLVNLPMDEWKDRVANDFENTVFEKYPVIGKIKQELYAAGAIYASMSGSGSAVYGLFKNLPQLDVLAKGKYLWISPQF